LTVAFHIYNFLLFRVPNKLILWIILIDTLSVCIGQKRKWKYNKCRRFDITGLICYTSISAMKDKLFNIGMTALLLLIVSACSRTTINTIPLPESLSTVAIPTGDKFQLQNSSSLESVRFDHLTVEDGISQNDIFSIFQDSTGFLWFATEDGLNKYDGQQFSIYKHNQNDSNSLSDNWVWDVIEDQMGDLWIGMLNGGLDRYNRELDQFTHFKHDPDNRDSISSNEVITIFEDSDGIIWVGTSAGLDRFDEDSFTHYFHSPDDSGSLGPGRVLSIFQGHDGILWVGTEGGGLNRFDNNTGTFSHLLNDPDKQNSLSQNNVRSIYEDSLHKLWVGTDVGLDQINKESGTVRRFYTANYSSVLDICEDKTGTLWIGTDGEGLNSFDRSQENFTAYRNDPGDPHSLSQNTVLDIFQDREGVLWIGTNGEGLNKLFLEGLNFSFYKSYPDDPDSLSNDFIIGIDQDSSGRLWVGTHGGLNRLNPGSHQWKNYQHNPDDPFSLSSNTVSDVLIDAEGLVWVGTFSEGLNSLDPETGKFTRYLEDPDKPDSFQGSSVVEIYQDSQGELWVGTLEGGLNRFDRENGIFQSLGNIPDIPDGFKINSAISILHDRNDFLWIGTFVDGLKRINLKNGDVFHYLMDPEDNNTLSNNLVIAIHEDKKGTIWVGTASGLNRYNPQSDNFTQYREHDGLTSDRVYGILEDLNENLWLSTNKGLFRFNLQTETFENYDVHDGLQSREFNAFSYHQGSGGEMFFGGIHGLNSFYPSQVQDVNPFIPPIVLTVFSQGGMELDFDQIPENVSNVTLQWPGNFFEFKFAALSFAHPDENQYAYLLEGFDDHWNFMNNLGFGRYTNLPGGNYTLRMIGSNNDGVWNETGFSMEITIVPPFWQTWSFRGIVFLIFLSLIIIYFYTRVRRVEARNIILENLVTERTAELTERISAEAVVTERNRLARELHDSVTQSLHGSALLAEAGKRLVKEGDTERSAGYFSRLSEISQQALQEMRLLVFELRPSALREVGLIRALKQRINEVEKRAGIEVKFSVQGNVKIPENIEDMLFKIAQEALNNALKHAKSTCEELTIHIEEKCEYKSIFLEVIDNGIGFDVDSTQSESGIGLKSMRERIEQFGGDFSIKSVTGKGTSVQISLNLKEEIHG